MFEAALGAVATIFILLLLGILLAHIGWVGDREKAFLSRLVVNVAVPATVIQNMLGNYTWDGLIKALPGLIIPAATMLILYPMAGFAARLFKLGERRHGVFKIMFSFSNAIFIGLPISEAILGSEAIPYTLLYYISNTLLFWTIGVRGIMRDAGVAPPLFSWQTFKTLASPALITFFLAIALLAIGVTLPGFVMKTAGYVAGMVTPLSTLFIGVVLYTVFKQGIVFDRGIAVTCLGRFIAAPLISIGLSIALEAVLPLPGLMKQTFLLLTMMPVMSQCPIVADRYGADAGFAAVGAALTTAMTLAIVPVAMSLTMGLGWMG